MTGEETVVADFVCRYAENPKDGVGAEPETGRVVMSEKRLVVAGDDRITIPLSAIVDVVSGNVPPNFRDLFDSTVTIGYRADGDAVETILIESGEEKISKFRTILFKVLLNGTKAKVRHPARIGGRVTDSPVRNAKLSISSGRVAFKTKNGGFSIELTTVIDFDRSERSLDATSRSTLLIRHADDGQATTTLVSPASTRRLNLLGRYLRVEYQKLLSSVADIDLSGPETRLLVTIYATDGDIDFTTVLDGDAARATNVLNSLRKKELIEEQGADIELTSKGQIIVSRRIEDVNI